MEDVSGSYRQILKGDEYHTITYIAAVFTPYLVAFGTLLLMLQLHDL